MQVRVNNLNKKKERPYPKLMIASDNQIVLFFKHEHGIVIDIGGGYSEIGYYTNDWDMCAFSDFEGSITISND
jgi:hypothetical protein